MKRYQSIIICLTLALTAISHSVSAQTSPGQEQEKPRMISLQVAAVGPTRLARFGSGKVKQPPAKKVTTPQPDTENGGQPAAEEEVAPPDSTEAAGGSTEFRVINIPEDEKPPNRLFIKTGPSQFESLVCSQNSLSSPVEFPMKGEVLEIFTREPTPGSRNPYRYKKFKSLPLPAGDRKILLTITKPLKTLKWTDPVVNAHDLTDLKEGSITVINTAVEQPVGCVIDGKKTLLPAERGRTTFDPVNGKKVARVVMVSKFAKRDQYSGQPVPFLDSFLRTNDGSKRIILTYSVPKKESEKGAKYLRSSLSF